MILQRFKRGISILLLVSLCLFHSGCDFDFFMQLWGIFYELGQDQQKEKEARAREEAERKTYLERTREIEPGVDRFASAAELGVLPGVEVTRHEISVKGVPKTPPPEKNPQPVAPSSESHHHKPSAPTNVKPKSKSDAETEAAFQRIKTAENIGLLPGFVSEDNPFANADNAGVGGFMGSSPGGPAVDARSMGSGGMTGGSSTPQQSTGGESHHHHPE